jgi:hypothetical protein
MANGDKAAAAGLATWPATADARNGYDNLNVRGDELATHMTTGTHTQAQVVGLSGALLLKVDKSQLESVLGPIASNQVVVRGSGGRVRVPLTPTTTDDATSKSYVDAHLRELRDLVDQLLSRVRDLERGA